MFVSDAHAQRTQTAGWGVRDAPMGCHRKSKDTDDALVMGFPLVVSVVLTGCALHIRFTSEFL